MHKFQNIELKIDRIEKQGLNSAFIFAFLWIRNHNILQSSFDPTQMLEITAETPASNLNKIVKKRKLKYFICLKTNKKAMFTKKAFPYGQNL